jgi:chromosome segregation ATPase
VEDRISELKDKIQIKGKTEENLVKQLKSCGKNIQELNSCIKRPNLRIMGIEEGEEVQSKKIYKIFDKIITENFPNPENILPIQVKEASRIPNRLGQNSPSPWHIIINTISTESRKRILKDTR